jgi:hypothetical protein
MNEARPRRDSLGLLEYIFRLLSQLLRSPLEHAKANNT